MLSYVKICKIRKNVNYFLGRTENKELDLKKEGGLLEAKWFTLEEISDLKMYGDMLPIITKGIKRISKY